MFLWRGNSNASSAFPFKANFDQSDFAMTMCVTVVPCDGALCTKYELLPRTTSKRQFGNSTARSQKRNVCQHSPCTIGRYFHRRAERLRARTEW
mmetsp:Transcript_18449/g.51266  ORF Transcript_18449/g.51266 Transcript_18449/m.51266 type:complete len:94 (-) Transcript_18449:248-529(-)